MFQEQSSMITPDMKVGTLLELFPELESVLIEIAPMFKRLKNPVLRKTVAKVATLERAAGMANIPTRDLIVKLRIAIGQPSGDADIQEAKNGCTHSCTCMAPQSTEDTTPANDPPSWFAEDQVHETIDADMMLAAGKVPIGRIVQSAKLLAESDILRVTVSFKPLPMIDALEQQGFRTNCRVTSTDSYQLFVAPAS